MAKLHFFFPQKIKWNVVKVLMMDSFLLIYLPYSFYSILFYEVWKDEGYMKREQFLAAFSFRERSCFWAEMKSQNCNLSTVKNFLSSNWVGYQTFVVGWVEEFRLYIPAAVNRENQISLWISSVAWYFGLDLLFFEVKNTHGCDIH